MILVLVAHSDDEVLGCGGAIAKYAQEGEYVVSIIFTSGDPVNKKKEFIIKRRAESISAGKILGVKDTVFLGLPDNPLSTEFGSKKIKQRVTKIIHKLNPRIIFTHCPDDPHPTHAGIAHLVKKITKETKTTVYTFTIGSPLKIRQRDKPRLYIDISETYNKKKDALKQFHSQECWLIYFKFIAYLNNRIAGLKSHHKYAEVFYKW